MEYYIIGFLGVCVGYGIACLMFASSTADLNNKVIYWKTEYFKLKNGVKNEN